MKNVILYINVDQPRPNQRVMMWVYLLSNMEKLGYWHAQEIWVNGEIESKHSLGIPLKNPHEVTQDISDIYILDDASGKSREYLQEKYNIPEDKCKPVGASFSAIAEMMMQKYEKDEDKQEILQHIAKNGVGVFNYSFVKKHQKATYHMVFDVKEKMYYTERNGKRMYFPKSYSVEQAVACYANIAIEQDEKSPHRYIPDGSHFAVQPGDTIIDAGVAEGFFVLDVIDIIKKAYLIEPGEGWIEALKLTFRDYQDKVVIMKEFLTDDPKKGVMLNDFIGEKIDLIKIDIDGPDVYTLLAGDELLKKHHPKVLACTYHNVRDEEKIGKFLRSLGYETEVSDGYMWYPFNHEEIGPNLVRGVIRGHVPEAGELELAPISIEKKDKEYLYFFDVAETPPSIERVVNKWIDDFYDDENAELLLYFTQDGLPFIEMLLEQLKESTAKCSINLYMGNDSDEVRVFQHVDYYIETNSKKDEWYKALAKRCDVKVISI